MKKKFSASWKSSKQPRKQRKYRYNAPLHLRQKMAHAHLSKELIKKYKRRSMAIRKGDKVRIARGSYKNHVGKIERVDLKRLKAYVEGIEITKKDGTKTTHPIDPSNLIITELILDDKKRHKILERKLK